MSTASRPWSPSEGVSRETPRPRPTAARRSLHWTGTAGTGDLRTHTSVPRNGRRRIGSVTKSFVAALVLKLVDEKKIVLDAPVGRHTPRRLIALGTGLPPTSDPGARWA
ncbi:serine hydrolase domain-containing protein [Streptosporangium saharense]|uniref:serine hydrolase domain-containing protein n=1 Tax=Streptosporangium saharense TaxID=1706840 RepID=UPI003323CE3C